MIPRDVAVRSGFNITDGPTDTHEELMSKLCSLIPGVITEDGKIDVVALRKLVAGGGGGGVAWGGGLTDSNHRLELKFAGKGLANHMADLPTNKELKVEYAQSKNFDSTQNVMIRGDNLDVLKILRQNYYGSVKMIYIDPPYNTGNDGFVYDDDFRKNNEKLIEDLGLTEETVERFQDLYGTKTHSGWLAFMYPRLKVARDLLADDGVIFVSIDDHEQANLKLMCDEIFGEANFIANVIWQKKYSPQNDAKHLSDNHDFILTYAKNAEMWRPNLLPRTEKQDKAYSNTDNDPRGPWKSSGLDAKRVTEKDIYEIKTPSGRIVLPPSGSSWRVSNSKFEELVRDNRIWFGKNGNNVPSIKRFLSEVKQGVTPLTIWLYADVGHTQSGTQELKRMGVPFSNPKPHTLIEQVLRIGANKDAIVLDFFAGSGTTGEAIMRLNTEDGGNRKFILVQIDEKIKQDQREAIEFCKKNHLEPVISSITLERLSRAGATIKKNHPNTDVGYRVLSLKPKPKIMVDESQDILLSTQHTKRDASDTLFNMFCATGKPLNTLYTTVVEGKLYEVDGELYVLGDVDITKYKDRRINVDGWGDDATLEQYLNLPRSNVEIIY